MKEVSVKQLKRQLRKAIKKKYDVSMAEFCRSDIPQQLNLGVSPKSLEQLLSGSTNNISSHVFEKLCEHLGLGKLEMVTTRKVTTTFFIEENSHV